MGAQSEASMPQWTLGSPRFSLKGGLKAEMLTLECLPGVALAGTGLGQSRAGMVVLKG